MADDVTPTREECIEKAGRILAEGYLTDLACSPREIAIAAWHPTSPYTVEEIEDRIRAKRGYA